MEFWDGNASYLVTTFYRVKVLSHPVGIMPKSSTEKATEWTDE